MNIDIVGEDTKAVNEIKSLVKRTNKDDPNPHDIVALRKEFDAHPEVYRDIGNISMHVFNTVLESAVGKSVLTRECSNRYIDEIKSELGYGTSTFIEQMLIDEIAVRWLRLQITESDHHRTLDEPHSLEVGVYMDKRLNAAQTRYLRSVQTLLNVRKMIAQTQAKGVEMYKDLMS